MLLRDLLAVAVNSLSCIVGTKEEKRGGCKVLFLCEKASSALLAPANIFA